MADRSAQHRWRVRPLEDSDEERWRALYRDYARFYQVAEEGPGDPAGTVWAWLRDPDHELECLLVEAQRRQVVGLAHYRPVARPLAASPGCYLDDLFVAPGARGRGAVDALLLELRRLARLREWSVVRWITADDNYRGRAAYDRHAARTTWITYDMTP